MVYTDLILTIIVAVLACFFGYKLNKVMLALIGFTAGYHLGTTLADVLALDGGVIVILSVIIGLIFGFVSFKLYLIGVFITCFMLTYVLCEATIDVANLKQILGLVCGVIVGVLGVIFTRPIIMLATSLGGAFLLVDTILDFFGFASPIVTIVAGLVVALVAYKYQANTNPSEA